MDIYFENIPHEPRIKISHISQFCTLKKFSKVSVTQTDQTYITSFRCIECDLVLCGGCIADHKRSRVTLDHRIISIDDDLDDSKQSLDRYALTFCRYHTRNVIKYFCNTCDETVCRVCTILEHREHQFVYPKEAIPQQKPLIEALLTQTKKHLPILRTTMRDINTMQTTLKDCRQSILSEINAKTQARIDALLLSKNNLIEDLNRVYTAKQKTLSLQSDSVELELGKISGCCSFAENVLKFGNEIEILQIKSRLQQLNNLSIKLDVEEDDSIQYVSETDSVQTVIDSLGKISASQTFASLSYAEGEGLKAARVGVETKVVVHAQNRHGKKNTGSDRVEAAIVLPDDTKTTLNAEDNGKHRKLNSKGSSKAEPTVKSKPKPPCGEVKRDRKVDKDIQARRSSKISRDFQIDRKSMKNKNESVDYKSKPLQMRYTGHP